MNNNISNTQKMGELFADAAREIIEKGRIKAQMNRIMQIVDADKGRLKTAYSEIGKMYCDGTLEKNAGKVEVLKKTIKHLEERIAKAKIRYEELQQAHSVDECTEAFKSELQSKVKQAKDASLEYARDLSGKAKVAAADFSGKASDALGDAKIAAADAAAKARLRAEDITARAVAAAKKAKKGEAVAELSAENTSWDSFDESLDELLFDDDDDSYIEEYTEEDMAAAADIGAILQNIAFALDEVEKEVEKAEEASAEEEPAPEEESAPVAEEQISDSGKPADEPLETAQGEESPESFTF